METIHFEFPAAEPAQGRAMSGVVGSGDLEVMIEPYRAGCTTVSITTAVGGMDAIWEAVLTRILTVSPLPASRIEIHDFGATPGVIRMRIEQAFEALAVTATPSPVSSVIQTAR